MEDPGIIFVAVPGDKAPKIISSLKFPGTDYSIIGPDTFTSGSFLEGFQKYPQERAKPGYFTNGIYAVAPFLNDIANEKAQVFSEKFIRKYGDEPSWIAACYYDAAMVAAEAIRRVGVHGEEEIRKDRRDIREFLAGMSTLEIAVSGITGPIYFDKNRDARAPFLPVVVYRNQKLYPAYSQYQPGHKIGEDSLNKALDGEIIVLGDKVMNKTDIVYTGITVNDISNLNVRQSVFTADFHIWFRYKGDFYPSNIMFVNAVRPFMLEYPLVDKTNGDMMFKSFHVKADFKNTFDFHDFPFDHHHLKISFRHTDHTREKLIYTSVISEFDKSVMRLDPLSGWEIKKIKFYQDIITDSEEDDQDFSYSQKAITYSQFNADIHIRRKGPDVALRCFLPLIVIALALYMTYFIPYHRYGSRAAVVAFALAAVSVYHWKFLSDTEVSYWSIAEYAIFALYGLLSLSVGVTVGISILTLRKKTFLIRQLNRGGKVFHGIIVLAAGIGIWWLKG
jgi:branched-chain amino acid transport system substrate-binding protein